MIDATHLKAHRTAAILLKKSSFPLYRTHKRRIGFKTLCSLQRRRPWPWHPQKVSNYKWLYVFLDSFPNAKELLADRGYEQPGFVMLCSAGQSRRVFRQKGTGISQYFMMKNFTGRGIKSRLYSVASRNDAGLPYVTIGASTPSFRQYVSPVPLSFLIDEST